MLFEQVIYISRRGIATGRILLRPDVFNVLSFPRPPGGRRLHFGGRHTIIEHIMNKGRHNRTAELRRFLQTQLDAHIWPEGGELPSFRSFSQKFGLGYGAVQRVMREFHQAGKLEIIPRRGCFVRKTESGDGRPVGILVPDNMMPGGFIETALKAIEKYAVRIGYPLKIIRTRKNMDLTEDNFNEIRSLGAAVLLGEYDTAAIRKLPEAVPLAGILLHDDFAGTASTVELDPFQSAGFATSFFREKGIRDVWIFCSNRPINRTRCRIFEYTWKEAGGRARLFNLHRNSRKLFARFTPKIGCFFGEDDLFRNLNREYAAATGRKLTENCVPYSIGGKFLLLPGEYPPVASHVPDWKLLGVTAFEEVVARLNNPLRPPRRIYLPGRFVDPHAVPHEKRKEK